MPRLTSEELRAARQRKMQEEEEAAARAREEFARALQALYDRRAELEQRKEKSLNALQQHATLASVVDALYTEIDKLAKKAPREPVSDMTVEMTNQAIVALRDLLAVMQDEFAARIAPLVPAGDAPETRDVLLLLGQMRAALERFQNYARREQKQIDDASDALRREENQLREKFGEEDEDDEDDDDIFKKSLHRW